ncbi:uncharacterized protein [Arachis hypogaea]|uniref:uncharacterized protein n=1 Tax=Arachis hypogaea TaxID=3818 RepID=UPI003B222E02
MNFQLPRQFTLPTTLTLYDGLGDPKQHVKKFRSIMIVNGASDPILCRCFPSFLDGPALDWFCSLPADSISRFQELARQFEDHFAASAIYLHDSDYLTTIKQGPQESLKDYITRFTKVAMRIPDLHPEVHLHAIKSGLRPGKFQETIAVTKPKTLAEFREKAKDLLERLARQGHLDKFIAGHMQRNTIPTPDTSAAGTSSKGKEKAPAQPRGDNVVATVHGDLQEARRCYNTSLKPIKKTGQPQVNSIKSENIISAELDPRADFENRPMPNEELTKISLTGDPMQFTFVGTSMNDEERKSLESFLRQNVDLFAWTSADMPGIDPSVITHKLNINPAARFMDAYSGYNQILMHPKDQEKTAFITEAGNYCYNVMPFGLKNAGATYQRLMNKIFEQQIGQNIEVYVDDMKQIRANSQSIFVSKSLQNAELRYPMLEKVALALVFSSRRLRPYFQSHTIIVKTGQPLRQILSKPELAGRLIKWAIELSEFDIQYQPRRSIKSQHLVDFVAELTEPCSVTSNPEWSLFVDGASNPHGAGVGMLLENSEGIALEHSLRFSFKASNNQAEYEALIAGLRLAADLHVDNLKVYCDSLLVVQQVNHSFQTKDPILLKYLDIVQQLLNNFSKIEIIHIPREQNPRADVLSKLATTQAYTATLLQSILDKPSTETFNILNIVNKDSWQHPYIQYLRFGFIPEEIEDKSKFRRQATFFTLLNNTLYRRGYSRPLLKCLDRLEANLVLSEAHEGICGIHSGARSLAQRILRAGFYWPTIWEDSKHKVRSCENCQ